jgi:hypothetical protein
VGRGIFKQIQGRDGKVTIPGLGALVGTFTNWNLTRKGEDGGNAELYDLHGVLSFVNQALFEDPTYVKSVEVTLSKSLNIRLQTDENTKTVLNGRALVMEGVRLWPEERP